jgi:ketose-bisphosphate aldolase
MLVSSKEMLLNAQKGKYAVAAINTQGGNYDIIWSICKAAEEMSSPIILAHYVSTGAYSGNDWFVEVCKWCANKVSVPVAIHLDHGDSFDICMEALKLGFTSLMIDASSKSVEENAIITNEVIKVAHLFGVPVEAEIGELARLGLDGSVIGNKNIADPNDIKRFLELCSPDSLAIGIGNAHGYYKGEPDIRLEVLEAVRKFSDIPFVLHGCTGMSEEIIKKSIDIGVCKINFGTQIRYDYVKHYKEGIDTMDHQGHSWKLSQYASKELTEDVKKIIELSGSANRV